MLIGVVAHVNREHLVDKLIRETRVDIIRWDDGLPSVKGCANNHIRVLTALHEQSRGIRDRWCIVLEDDVKPVNDFRDQAKAALYQCDNETPLVGLYLGTTTVGGRIDNVVRPAVHNAEVAGAHWITSDWFISCPAYAVKTEWLPAMIDHISTADGPVDVRIDRWARSAGIETWYTQPSLVNHDDAPSLINGHPNFQKLQPRRAWKYGTRDEWSTRTSKMAHVDSDGWW